MTPNTTQPTPAQVLDLPLDDNPSGATTVRGYLVALLTELWDRCDMFSSKRPFGMSDWPDDLFAPLVKAGYIEGEFNEDGALEDVDTKAGDPLIAAAIAALGRPTEDA